MHPALIIVSNRLPVSVKKTDGKLEFYPSVGGLATGLSSYTTSKRNKWIGWPGIANEDVTDEEKHQITKELKKHNCYPVFLSKKQLDNYYNGYSNSVLWPIFHELKPTQEALENDAYWRAYKRVNESFAEVVLALSGSGSTVWVHDYQLLLLPAMLRKKRPHDKIGFFLHIPFPRVTAFDTIPHSRQLLGGLIGSDLLGFHTTSYVANFLENCQKIGIGTTGKKELILPDRVVRVTDFPMGIDYGKFARATKLRAVRRELLKLRSKYHGKRVILTVDRLDPTKGLVERITAYQQLLRDNPELHRKVVMVMLAVPSRTEIEEYKSLKDKLESLVSEVNQEFGTARWQPVDYMYMSVPFERLSALYQVADVAFIAPIKDGMNLVAKEYIASRSGQSGVLILSETAGAAEELQDAIMVNPLKNSSLVGGLAEALNLPQKELKQRVNKMQEQLSEFTVQKWAGTFMDTLRTSPGARRSYTRTLTPPRTITLRDSFRLAKKRLLLLDYDGVLVTYKNNPYKAVPTERLRKVLRKLSALPNTNVVIVSGRSKADLTEWFDDIPVSLAAEHGTFTRKAGTKRWQTTREQDHSWRDVVLPILQVYTEKTPGATIETKEAAVVWHYRQASPYYAQKHLVILKRLLARYARRYNLVVHQGNMILEVRARGATKGHVAETWMQTEPSFVLCIGDDYTDEDMFEALPDWAHTIKVGRGKTAARLRLQKSEQVLTLLEKLSR
jgi:trehalose 6-phosphate synthase/phosphatase